MYLCSLEMDESIEVSREVLVHDYKKLKKSFERDLSVEMEQQQNKKSNKEDETTTGGGDEQSADNESSSSLSLETLIKFLNDNHSVFETKMTSEHDRMRMQNVLNISKDIKSLAKEAIGALKIDLMSFYNLGKATASIAISEIGIIKQFSE